MFSLGLQKKKDNIVFCFFSPHFCRCTQRHHVKLGEDDDDDDEIPPALHQPRERFNLVPKSFTNSLPNEIWERTQRGIVRGNSRAIRDAQTLENGRHWTLVIGRAITITSASRISRHDFMMSCSFRNSLVGSGRRGEALRALLSDAKSSFVASSSVVVRREEEEEEQTEEESLGVFVAKSGEGIKTNAKIFTLESDLYYPLSSTFAINSARTKAPRFVEAAKRVASGFEVHASMALNLLLDSSSYRASCPPLTGQLDPSVPLLWDASQIALLRGTPTFESVVTRKTFVKNAHAGIFGEENKAVSYEMFAWAISTVLSRALSVSSANKNIDDNVSSFYSFIPGVDLLNHDANANCEIRLVSNTNNASTSIEVYAIRDIENDKECTISYGNHRSNDELLRKYGFCVPNNRNDSIDVRLRASNTFLKVDRKTVDELFLEENRSGQNQDDFVSKYNRNEVLDSIAEQKATLDEVAEREPALVKGGEERSGKKWLRAIRLLRKGQYELLDATERAFH